MPLTDAERELLIATAEAIIGGLHRTHPDARRLTAAVAKVMAAKWPSYCTPEGAEYCKVTGRPRCRDCPEAP